MARGESPVGGRRDRRLIDRGKREGARSDKKMDAATFGDGPPPGTAPISGTDPVMQRRRLEDLEPTGLSRVEFEKLDEFRRNRIGE